MQNILILLTKNQSTVNKVNWIIFFGCLLLSIAAILYVLKPSRLNEENSKKVNAEVTWILKNKYSAGEEDYRF